jgi:diguanylate cyclase (GGDEF)-like protein
MRLISRNDLFLLLGLTVALFAIVSRPLGRVLAFAQDIDESRGLQLLPGLVILAVVFMFHQVRKRHEVRSEAQASAAEARQAKTRVLEMERLVSFGQALGESLDDESIGIAAKQHLPTVAGGRGAWAMVLSGGQWRPLFVTANRSVSECELAARRALGETDAASAVEVQDICFPMRVGGEPVGVLGVTADPVMTDTLRIAMAAAATLLAGSLKNAELFKVVHEHSVRDSLTGCFNRRYALEVLDAELRRAQRSRLPMSVIMFDLDHFKDINDRFGHLCGDAVLAAIGTRMKTNLRGSDLKCRYGGEEFLILLPETSLAGAQRVAELLRIDIEKHPVQTHNKSISITASFGLTTATLNEIDPTAVIARADSALYRAKESGRNRICCTGEEQTIA